MSVAAIDTGRTTERLSAFLSKVNETEPVDNFYVDLPTINEVLKSKELIDGGRQSMIPLDTARNTTITSFTGYDTFNTSPQDTVRTAVYALINYGGTATISWEEMRETANSDVRVYDLVKQKRNGTLKSMKDTINTALYAAAPGANDILPLPSLISTTASAGGIAAGGYWVSQEVTSVGAFSVNGMTQMRALWNNIVRQGQGSPDISSTTQSIFQSYEASQDVDVRYSNPDDLARGALKLTFKGKPLIFDAATTTGHLYMWNREWLKLYVDTDGNFAFDKFIEPANQKVYTAKLVFRGQLTTSNRRANGRLTGLT